MGDANVPVAQRIFGAGHKLRPNFVQPYRCKNLLIEGIHIIDSPMWVLTPTLCTNVTIRNVTVDTQGKKARAPNTDGCDPDSCTDVLIEDCVFNTGDDCIAIKAGRNRDGRRVNVPCQNIIVRECRFEAGHGGRHGGQRDFRRDPECLRGKLQLRQQKSPNGFPVQDQSCARRVYQIYQHSRLHREGRPDRHSHHHAVRGRLSGGNHSRHPEIYASKT